MENEVFKAHKVKSTCRERFLSLILSTWRTSFYIATRAWQSKMSRSAGNIKMGKNSLLLLGPWSLNGVALVQLTSARYLMMTRVFSKAL